MKEEFVNALMEKYSFFIEIRRRKYIKNILSRPFLKKLVMNGMGKSANYVRNYIGISRRLNTRLVSCLLRSE